jgi:exonuclease III
MNAFLGRKSYKIPVWGELEEPAKFGAWNCNGLESRLKSDEDRESLKSFIKKEEFDVLCLTETWLKAAGGPKPWATEEGEVKASMNRFFLDELEGQYIWRMTCQKQKRGGTAVLINKRMREPAVRYTLDHVEKSEPSTNHETRTLHHEEGRVIVLHWPHVVVLCTYAPNKGSTLKSFDRREKWDASIRAFLNFYAARRVAVVWLGDLNVAPDVSSNNTPHPTPLYTMTMII